MATVDPNSVAQDQIKAFVRRIEALDDEIKVLNEDKSEVYAESKANGFDNKILRKVVAERRKDHAERMEQDALFELYWNAVHDIAHAHVEIIEEFDPETGEIEPQPVAPDQLVGANTAQTDGGTNADLHASAGAASVEAPVPFPEPASPPSEIAEPGDESAVLPSAALVVADRTKPNPVCQDPEDCGIEASWNHVCGSCLRRRAHVEAAGAVQ